MNVAPVTPAEAKSIIISPTATYCQAFIKLFQQLPLYFYRVVNFLWRADGSISNDFLSQIFNPGDLKWSASALSQTSDWLLCDGSAVSRTTYADLYAAITTTYGSGDGSNTFNLPDLRGRFPIGVGTTTGLTRDGDPVSGDNFSLGDKGGEKDVVLEMENLPSEPPPLGGKVDKMLVHRTSAGQEANSDRKGLSQDNSDHVYRSNSETDHTDNALGNLGDDEAHNNIPPYLALNCYIKT